MVQKRELLQQETLRAEGNGFTQSTAWLVETNLSSDTDKNNNKVVSR